MARFMEVVERAKERRDMKRIARRIRKAKAEGRFVAPVQIDTKPVSFEWKPADGLLVSTPAPQQPSTRESTPLQCGALWDKCRASASRIVRRTATVAQDYDVDDVASAIFSALWEHCTDTVEVVNIRDAWRSAMKVAGNEYRNNKRMLGRAQDFDLCADYGMTALQPRELLVDGACDIWSQIIAVARLGIDNGTQIARVLGYHSAVELREALLPHCTVIGKRWQGAQKPTHWSWDDVNWRETVAQGVEDFGAVAEVAEGAELATED